MSLFKQIQSLVTVLLLTTLVVVMKIDFDGAREFTANQLFNNGKNSANILALSLGTHPGDRVFWESSINAMFDGGAFEEISLVDVKGQVIHSRNETIRIDGVPAAFVDAVDLKVPVAEADVVAGWTPVGILQVKAHSGPSYIKLWETFKNLCLLFVVIGAVSSGASYVILKYLLESLVNIRQQAEAISDNRFIINEKIPGTPELKMVVVAMNTMVDKVKLIYDRQLEYLKNYQALNYKDSHTGLHNRKYFVQQLGHFLDSESEFSQGQMFILSLSGMESTSIPACHPVLDAFFRELAGILVTETSTYGDGVTARLPRHEYGVILPNGSREEGLALAETIMARIVSLVSTKIEILGMIRVFGGFASFNPGDEVKSVLSKTDYALSVAKSGPAGVIEVYCEEGRHPVLGKFEWKTLIEDALASGRFVLTTQPVLSDNGELHREVYVNLIDDQDVCRRAGYFMPMVITQGLANRLDCYVLEKSAGYVSENHDHVLAVNLTTDFCIDRVSFMWLRNFLQTNKSVKQRLVFEIHESTLIQHPDICLDISGLLKGMGYGFGVDQFTLNASALDLLKDLRPAYIKVDREYLNDADQENGSNTAVNALTTLTDSLDIRLIAAKIENDHQRRALSAKHIHFFQGRGVSDITPLMNTHEL